MSHVQDFDFFKHYIPTHTCDFSSTAESQARLGITSAFLDAFPASDVGFEFVVFPRTLDPATIEKQVNTFHHVRDEIENKHGARVHASLHFPTTSDSRLSLASGDEKIIGNILRLAGQCARLSVAAGIDTVVIHTGSNIALNAWNGMDQTREAKEALLDRVVKSFPPIMHAFFEESGYDGKLAWENVPYPFDIPAFTHSNIVSHDFIHVFNKLEAINAMDSRLGICLDICHSWILSRVATHFEREYNRTNIKKTPPGIYPHEHDEFMESRNPNRLNVLLGDRVVHVHLADSKGAFDPVAGMQPTEGDELGTGDLTASEAFVSGLNGIIEARQKKGLTRKLKCNLEIKDTDFSNPEKTARSLIYLGKRFWKR